MLRQGPPLPDWKSELKFNRRDEYREMLEKVFLNVARLTKSGGTIWIRTSSRKFTREATAAAIRTAWPCRQLYMREDVPKGPTQTPLFGHTSTKPGEVDFLITRKIACMPGGFAPSHGSNFVK